MAAPKGVRIRILSVEEAVAAQENGEFERNRILVLLKSVQELTNAINAGLALPEIQIGGLGGALVERQSTMPLRLIAKMPINY